MLVFRPILPTCLLWQCLLSDVLFRPIFLNIWQSIGDKCRRVEEMCHRKDMALRQTKMVLKFREEALKRFEKAKKENTELSADDKDNINVSHAAIVSCKKGGSTNDSTFPKGMSPTRIWPPSHQKELLDPPYNNNFAPPPSPPFQIRICCKPGPTPQPHYSHNPYWSDLEYQWESWCMYVGTFLFNIKGWLLLLNTDYTYFQF